MNLERNTQKEESANALRQLGVSCTVRVGKNLLLPGETAAGVYALFESALYWPRCT